ncbi:MAG: D-glycero-beta-D-manno-heptose-7-phosphate kinase [Deltaproteobacteria bacterium]|nr:D-glycero-beta-D-manno-heptose-7-phosphate kinase [Deltaproteobacteria bacterium]
MPPLLDLLKKFPAVHLLVVGDLMIDRFIWGDVERISPEAPVPVLRVTDESIRLGGAANVIHNIRSLGGQVTACGVVGVDGAGKRMLQELRRIGASTAGVVVDRQHQTIQKTRVIARPRHQQIVRLDRESVHSGHAGSLSRVCRYVAKSAERFDGIVISDYGKGIVNDQLLQLVAGLSQRKKLPLIVDPKKENYARYRGATLLTPNKDEASDASGIKIRDEKTLLAAGARLVRLWRAQTVLVTRGPDGSSLFRARGAVQHFRTEPKDMFDVTGAGDTVVAACALALACGAGFEDAAVLSNMAAGLVGDEVGTVAVSAQRLGKILKDRV